MGNILDSNHYAKVLNLCISRIAHLTGYARDLPDNRLVARRVADYEAVELRQAVRDLDTAVTDFLDSNQAVWQYRYPADSVWYEAGDEECARSHEAQGAEVRPLYLLPTNMQPLSDAECEAVYDAVTRANLTRDVKSLERKREIVRTALLATSPAAKPEQGDTCERCGATSLAEAENMCIPNGDTCPGCEHPLEQRWAGKAQPKPAGEAVNAEALAKLASEKPKYTYGHCPHKQLMGGCPFPNVQCNYPDCDRRLSGQEG